MHTRIFQPAGAVGNWSLAINWSNSTKPVEGDTAIIADGKTCYIDESTPRLAMLRNAETGLRNGKMLINNGISVTFDSCDTGTLGVGNGFIKNNGNVSATINGSITMAATADNYGVYNDGTGTLTVNGNLTGGSVSNARGGFNYSTGKIIVNGKVSGGTHLAAPGLRNHNAAGRCFVNGDIQAGWTGSTSVVAFYNNADSYHFQAYGGRLLDKDGNAENRAGTPTSINSRGGSLLYNWLITAEVDSAADLAAIDNLTGDANVAFVQTGNITVTTPPNIGFGAAAFLGQYSGYDAVAQKQYSITFDYGTGEEVGTASLFAINGASGVIERVSVAANLDMADFLGFAAALCYSNLGVIRNCYSSGAVVGQIAAALVVSNDGGVLEDCYTIVDGASLLVGNSGGTVTHCYHLAAAGQGVEQLTLAQMHGRRMLFDYVNVWQDDTVDLVNEGRPYLPDVVGVIGADGYIAIYGGQDGVIDDETVLAIMRIEDDAVSFPITLPAGTVWHLVRTQISECGLESEASLPYVVQVDGDGEIRLAAPNAPVNLTATAAAGGTVRLRWLYPAAGQAVPPTAYRVYIDSGSGFDFDTPAATIAANNTLSRPVQWTSGALTHGTLYRFCVRSYSSRTGGESQNTNNVAVIADSDGPPVATGVVADVEVIG